MFQHDSVPVSKDSFTKEWFAKFGEEQLEWPVTSTPLNTCALEFHSGLLVLKITNALAAEWEILPNFGGVTLKKKKH